MDTNDQESTRKQEGAVSGSGPASNAGPMRSRITEENEHPSPMQDEGTQMALPSREVKRRTKTNRASALMNLQDHLDEQLDDLKTRHISNKNQTECQRKANRKKRNAGSRLSKHYSSTGTHSRSRSRTPQSLDRGRKIINITQLHKQKIGFKKAKLASPQALGLVKPSDFEIFVSKQMAKNKVKKKEFRERLRQAIEFRQAPEPLLIVSPAPV